MNFLPCESNHWPAIIGNIYPRRIGEFIAVSVDTVIRENNYLVNEFKSIVLTDIFVPCRTHSDDLHIADLAASHRSMNGSVRRKGGIDDFLEDR